MSPLAKPVFAAMGYSPLAILLMLPAFAGE